MGTLMMMISGKFAYQSFKEYADKKDRWNIFNELPKHVYTAQYNGTTNNGVKRNAKGLGVIVDGEYFSTAHIIESLEKQTFNMGRNIFDIYHCMRDRHAAIRGKELDIIIRDYEQDVFIADASKTNLPDFPCKPRTSIELGEKVYVIGNPQLTGTNVREGIITDLDGYGDDSMTNGCFGTDVLVLPGDSGCPVVSKEYELLGLARTNAMGLGYVLKIEKFVDYKP